MAKKNYFLVEAESNDPFQAMILIALGCGGLIIAFMAAAFLLPFLAAGGALWWWLKTKQNSPEAIAKRNVEELRELHSSVKYLAGRMNIPTPDRMCEMVILSVNDTLEGDRLIPPFMFDDIQAGCKAVLEMSGLEPLPPINEAALMGDVSARIALKTKLYDLQKIYQTGTQGVDEIFWYLCNCVGQICERLPLGDGFGDEPNDYDFTVEIQDVLTDVNELVEIILYLPFGDEDKPTLEALQKRSLNRMAAVSGKRVDELLQNPQKTPKPTDDKRSPKEVINAYLGGWPLLPLLWGRVAYRLPPEARFEHIHVLGGTGHGKTQLLQRLIREDLTDIYFNHKLPDDEDSKPKSLVVMDGQGDLIKNIASRSYCSPEDVMNDRVILIDPTDVFHPPALNMFDLNEDELDGMSPVDREMIYNGTIELYVYLFGALLDAEMTTRQATMFRYVASLMLAIPGATLDTLRDVMENGADYQPFIDKLPYAAQEFFRTQFLAGELDDAKKQVLWRLWGILSNKALSDMFNSPKNKIDLFAEMQRGTVILINTSKDFLKSDGSKIFGRFWVAMLAQAALRRAAVPKQDRVDTHVYIDEAHELIDEKVEEILNQARKYRIGLTLAHQNRGQLDSGTRATIAASTTIKMLGGVSDEDARSYAGDLRVDPETIMRAKKHDGGAEFVTFVKNFTDRALTLNVPFGTLERMDKMSEPEYIQLRENVRAKYCRTEGEKSPTAKEMGGDPKPKDGGFELGDHEEL